MSADCHRFLRRNTVISPLRYAPVEMTFLGSSQVSVHRGKSCSWSVSTFGEEGTDDEGDTEGNEDSLHDEGGVVAVADGGEDN